MVAVTRFVVTVYGPDDWCDPDLADALAEVSAGRLADAAQEIADLAPVIPAGSPVRVLVVEDLGPGPLMRNFCAFASSPARVREPVAV